MIGFSGVKMFSSSKELISADVSICLVVVVVFPGQCGVLSTALQDDVSRMRQLLFMLSISWLIMAAGRNLGYHSFLWCSTLSLSIEHLLCMAWRSQLCIALVILEGPRCTGCT